MKTITHQKTLGDLIGEWDMGCDDHERGENHFLSIKQACEYLNLHPNSIYRIIASDKTLRVYDLHAGNAGKPCYRILKSDLDDWLAGRQL